MIFRESIDICKFVRESQQSVIHDSNHQSMSTISHSCQSHNFKNNSKNNYDGEAVVLKDNAKIKQVIHKQSIKFYELEPWTENYYQVADYSKKQEINKNNKCVTARTMTNTFHTKQTPKRHNRTLSSKENSQSKLNKGQRVLSEQKQKQQQQQTQPQYNNKFNPVVVSNEERMKWELQLKIVMRRKKKLSNMLKMRHFRNSRYYTVEQFAKQSQKMHTQGSNAQSTNLHKMLKQGQTHNNFINEIISYRDQAQTLRESINPKLRSVYSLLKTASRNQGLNKKHSQSCGKKSQIQLVSHHDDSFIKIKPASMESTRYLSNSPAINGTSCLKSGMTQKGKVRLSLPTHNSDEKKRSHSLNLTMNSYTGHSLNIKNKLKLMKTNKNHKNSRASSRAPMKQKVEEISNLQKHSMFI